MSTVKYSGFDELVNFVKSENYYIDEIIGDTQFNIISSEGNIIYFFYDESRNSLFIKSIVSLETLNKLRAYESKNTLLFDKMKFVTPKDSNYVDVLYEIEEINSSHDNLINFIEIICG